MSTGYNGQTRWIHSAFSNVGEYPFKNTEEKRLSVIGFPDRPAFEAWFYSREYQEFLRPLRVDSGNWSSSYQGFDRLD